MSSPRLNDDRISFFYEENKSYKNLRFLFNLTPTPKVFDMQSLGKLLKRSIEKRGMKKIRFLVNPDFKLTFGYKGRPPRVAAHKQLALSGDASCLTGGDTYFNAQNQICIIKNKTSYEPSFNSLRIAIYLFHKAGITFAEKITLIELNSLDKKVRKYVVDSAAILSEVSALRIDGYDEAAVQALNGNFVPAVVTPPITPEKFPVETTPIKSVPVVKKTLLSAFSTLKPAASQGSNKFGAIVPSMLHPTSSSSSAMSSSARAATLLRHPSVLPAIASEISAFNNIRQQFGSSLPVPDVTFFRRPDLSEVEADAGDEKSQCFTPEPEETPATAAKKQRR